MELVDGPTLAAVIAAAPAGRSATASHAARLEIDRSQSRGSSPKRSRRRTTGIIHRDLKPQNIILRPTGR